MLTKSSWRITILSLLVIFGVSTTVKAQKVGEAYVKDGIPCVIIDVDEDGKHGLVMSLIPTEKAMKAAKKVLKKTGVNEKWFYVPNTAKNKVGDNPDKDYVAEFFNRTKCEKYEIRGVYLVKERVTTSLSGKENMQNVIDFCNEQDISIETYFPEFAWALSLGEGWYIPGINELKLHVKRFGFNTIGHDETHKIQSAKEMKAERNIFNASLENIDNKDLFTEVIIKELLWYPIRSSTFASGDKDGDFGGLATLFYNPGLGAARVEMSFGAGNVCAVCEVEF